MKILLISSQNGFGHVTRLIQIGSELVKKKYAVTLILSEKQTKLLPKNLNILEKFQIHNYPPYEIDGYLRTKKLSEITKPQVKLISSADIVIADNVLWPGEFNTNFYLHGHFLWSSILNNLDPRVRFEEKIRFNFVKKWFQIKNFSITNEFFKNLNRIVEVNMMRYANDDKVRSLPVANKTIWVATGSMARNKKVINSLQIFSKKFEFICIETHMMLSLGYRPKFVIGRPGLTTIRDCLSAGVQFVPLKINMDREVTSNVENLIKLKLVSREVYDEFSLNLNLGDLTDFLVEREFIEELWYKISEDSESVTRKILNNI